MPAKVLCLLPERIAGPLQLAEKRGDCVDDQRRIQSR